MTELQLLGRIAAGRPPVEAGSNQPLHLSGPRAWLVAAGRVDVFAADRHGDGAAGRRTHLFRVGEGGLLLGVAPVEGPDAPGLLGVGAAGTCVLEVSAEELRQAARDPGLCDAVAGMVDGWVEALCGAVARGAPPTGCVELGRGEPATPAADALLRLAGRVGWVRHEEGASLLFGRDGLVVNGTGHTPVSGQAWLRANGSVRVRVEDTAALLQDDDGWDGLERLHALVLRGTAQNAHTALTAERARLKRRALTGHGAFQGALSTLANTLDPSGRAPLPLDGSAAESTGSDALFLACCRVGEAAGISVSPLPRSADGSKTREPLMALARANRFRTRQVVLREGWWQADGGPFLAFQGEGAAPVALLPTPAGGYVAVDPVRGTETTVDRDLSDSLSPLAHTFYRPFPDHPLGIREVIRFGLHGRGRDVATVLAMGLAGGLLSMVAPIATGLVFNDIIPGAQRGQLLQVMLIMLAIAVAGALFSLTSGIALVRMEGRMGSAVQGAVWDRLLALPMPFFRPYTAGNLATRAMGIDAIRQILSGATVTALLGGMFSLFHFFLLFWYSPSLAWWAFGLISVAIAAALVAGRLQTRTDRKVAALQGRLAGMVLQFLSSVSKLRVAGAEGQAFAQWAHGFGEQRRTQFRVRTIGNALGTFQAGFPLAANLVLYAVAIQLMTGGAGEGIRTGDFLAFMTSFGICVGGLLNASTALMGALSAIPLYEEARPILTALPEVDGARSDPGILTGEVEIQHATFRYSPGGPPALSDVSLRIRAGEYVAFVGPSGSGKSTLLRLLLGFETPEQGAIYYDGQELAGLDVQAVRRQIGVVLQNGRLMSGDVFTNIVGSSSATLEDAWTAARMAGFEDDVKSMPMGMHTVVSEGGGTLSGGQRQRLMIARAIVQRPRLLFFDEATSALDNRTQAIVSESLERLRATRIVVAHRLSTILHADRIYVVQAGRIVQEGNYQELMAQEGLFRELAERQIA